MKDRLAYGGKENQWRNYSRFGVLPAADLCTEKKHPLLAYISGSECFSVMCKRKKKPVKLESLFADSFDTFKVFDKLDTQQASLTNNNSPNSI